MDKESDKRILDGPITSSMRADRPSQESIEELRERYARFQKLTAKKPATPFDNVLKQVERDGQAPAASTDSGAADSQDSQPSPSSALQAETTDADAEQDRFESATESASRRRQPLPSGRHPATPTPAGKGKVIIKV